MRRIGGLSAFSSLVFLLVLSISFSEPGGRTIDRKKLVRRHLPRIFTPDPLGPFPFTVGNEKFACTADVTGLQTFADFCEKSIPLLATRSEWCWHTIPNSHNYVLEDATEYWDVNGRRVPYASLQRTEAGERLRANHQSCFGFTG
jgi:protein-glucosylgalactosylhydroxylysine glucosidase